MAGRLLGANEMFEKEDLQWNRRDGFCRYLTERLDGQVFGATDGGGISLPPRIGYYPHTVGSTVCNGSASG
jgi:hypothetical protein